MNDWEKFAQALEALMYHYVKLWQCGLAKHNPELSIDDEVLCDQWCEKLVDAMEQPIYPPEHLRPWMLARIATAAMSARMCAADGTAWPDVDGRERLKFYLVRAWRTNLCWQWYNMGKDGFLPS